MESAIPPRLSIRAASKWANVSERTLRRMVADGRVSIVEERDGKKLLEMCDLDRLGLLGIKGETSKAPPPRQERVTDELTSLHHQVESLRQQVDSLTRERDRVTREADAWREQASHLLLALTPATKDADEAPKRRPWWRRWRG